MTPNKFRNQNPIFASTSKALLRSQRGMTLFEVIIAITIVLAFMTAMAGAFIGQMDAAKEETTRVTMKRIDQALQIYAVKNKGKYPASSKGLSAAEKYMPSGNVPTDAWGNEFKYVSPGSNSNQPYELISLGSDQKESDDDIKSWEE